MSYAARERLEKLKEKLKALLPKDEYEDAMQLLREFKFVFEVKQHYDSTGGWWKKLYYKIVVAPVLIHGYILDINVNRTAGRRMFGKYALPGTLTATLKRVKKGERITSPEYLLAKQICEVLNDIDKDGHC